MTSTLKMKKLRLRKAEWLAEVTEMESGSRDRKASLAHAKAPRVALFPACCSGPSVCSVRT